MKRILIALAATTILSTGAMADTIGVSMAKFDDNFLTVLRNGMKDYAATKKVDIQFEDAQGDIGRQLSQVQNFIAQKVSAIIVNAVDTDATPKISKLANDAGIPVVYVNRQPDLTKLPAKAAYVGSDEVQSGTLETQEVCKLLGGKGDVVVIMGDLANQGARQRTKDVHDVIAKEPCTGMKVIQEQTANWSRTEGSDLVTNWLSSGVKPAAIISNNDEMAIGAIQAAKRAGIAMDKIVIAGIDATQDGLAAMKAGELDVTVFQNAVGQGKGAIDSALKLAHGEKVDQVTWVPFELVTPATIDKYLTKN